MITRFKRFRTEFKFKTDSLEKKQAKVVIFVSNTLFVPNKHHEWESRLLSELLDHIETSKLEEPLIIGLPPFFIEDKINFKIITFNNYFIINLLIGCLLRRSFNKGFAYVIDLLLRKIQPDHVYFTNLSLPIEHLEYNCNYVEFCHGKGYDKLPYYFNNRDYSKLSEIITLDGISYSNFSKLAAFSNLKISFLNKIDFNNKEEIPLISKLKKSHKTVILFTLTHGYSKDEMYLNDYGYYLDNGLFPENFIEWIRSNEHVCVVFRRHPVHFQLNYKWVDSIMMEMEESSKNIFYSDYNYFSLFELLSAVDVHVTMCSGSVFDAAEIGLKSVTLCPSVQKMSYMNELVNNGMVEKASYENFDYNLFSRKYNIKI